MIKNYTLTAFGFAVLLLFLAGCQADRLYLKKEAVAQKRPISKNGIAIKTEKAEYPTSIKQIIVKLRNDSNKEYTTGVHVFLEKKVEDTWYEVPMKAESFTLQGMLHRPNESSSLVLSVNDLKYKLTPGEYRATVGEFAAPFEVVD
ncbi:immunoglobulin-like domain-containing protein [Pseudobacillus wudalianchiensis]|uniref:Bacterial Ig-like domain-containing protein n=1 Tax=Pseudobacillus wudalianchiensis TaxID=1743143 RepID=A0A1B9B918_9BACI|nr:immunoglobulin-like domain-containing protein [Bacillus wudalianchiensis]OCA92578.1 hypothetical protein A8F95_02460 [Bacillus wudalianchiensis]